jgi:hypothetical protein
MAETPDPRPPIPVYLGACGAGIVVLLFASVYDRVGDTTPRGWYATFAVGFELSGVLLIASPELRPIVEAVAKRIAGEVRTWPKPIRNFTRRLLRKGVTHVHEMTGTVSAGGSLHAKAIRGYVNPPGVDAGHHEQIAYLLRVTEQLKRNLGTVEDDLRQGLENVRGELQRTALDLTEQTTKGRG